MRPPFKTQTSDHLCHLFAVYTMAPSAIELNYGPSKAEVASKRLDGREEHDLVLKTFRVLIADLVQHYNGGHPG